MKKLIVKIKVIDIPYSPAVEAIPQKWTKEVDGEIISFYEQPLKVVDAQMVNDESYTYHPDVAAIPEQPEVSHEEIIAQTQGSDEELAQWLAGDSFKYPQDHWVEYIDINAELAEQAALQQAQNEISKGIKGIAVFKVQVKKKSLSQSQIAGLFSNAEIGKIINTLSTGSLPLAVALINAYQADGVLVTEEDKAAVIAAIE
jgi:hypothetical protein